MIDCENDPDADDIFHFPDGDDPDFDGGSSNVRENIPDEYLWQMFSTGVSFRALSKVLELAFKAADAENRFHTSKSHLYRSYQRLFQVKEDKYKAIIREDESYGTICFDHQNTQNISRKFEGTTHRLAIVWYSNEVHNVLGMKTMPDKTARSQVNAIEDTCREFSIESKQIVALACDNENANVGNQNGTCVLLERAHEKSLLRPTCRRHIEEIVIKTVYNLLFKSDTPNNKFYEMLKPIWSELRETNFPMTRIDDDEFIQDMGASLQSYEELKDRAISELRAHAQNKQVRDDYQEVILVALKFLGENVDSFIKGRKVKFRTLINPSNARFMANIIQGIEVYLFRESLEWDTQELIQLKFNIMRFASFAALIYVRYWDTSPILFDAPINDLSMLKELQNYKLIDEDVANAAISAFSKHLNFMSEELSPL